jgi:hypothetical protein
MEGKRVAVIGIGSSGIQVTATIAPQVSKLYTWVRSPTWVTAGFAQKFAGPDGGNFNCKLGWKNLSKCVIVLKLARY